MWINITRSNVILDQMQSIAQSDYIIVVDAANVCRCVVMRFCDRHSSLTMNSRPATPETLTSLPVSAVFLDASGRIVAVNDSWKEFGRRNGLRVANSAIGSNYLQYCQSDEPRSRQFAKALKSLFAGQLDLLTFIYPCHSPSRERWFSLIGFPLSADRAAGVALLHVNLTEMLPVSRRRTRAKNAAIPHLNPPNKLEAMSSAIERSVSETLSAQLSAMVEGRRQRSVRAKGMAHKATDQINLIRRRLSNRQMQVLRLLGEGKTNKEMAKALFLSPNTIKLHVSAILKRLKLSSRIHAALLSSSLPKKAWVDLTGGDLSSWKTTHANAHLHRPRSLQ